MNIGTSGGIEDNEVKEQGSKLREEAEGRTGRVVDELLDKQREEQREEILERVLMAVGTEWWTKHM